MRRATWIGLCLVCFSTDLAAQAQFERQVRKQIEGVGETFRKRGYELTHQVYTGQLNEGTTDSVTVRLRSGIRYAIVGVCDNDCADLDLHLFDPSDREIAKDVEKDDVPVVEAQAAKNGEYTLKIDMAACKEEPCTYGFGVFATEQDDFDRQVRAQLDEAGKRLKAQGYEGTHHIYTGALKQQEREDVTVELNPGRVYVVLGVCDRDCRDIDLILLNSAGRELSRDVEADDYPAVETTPARREKFTVRAIMAQCGVNPCRYGFGVFAK